MSETTEKTTDRPHEAEVLTYQTSQGTKYGAKVSFGDQPPWHGPMRSTWAEAKSDKGLMVARGGGLEDTCIACRGWGNYVDKKCPACGGTGSGVVPAVRAIPQAAPVPMPKLPAPRTVGLPEGYRPQGLVDAFDRGRSEGHADVAARLRLALDPSDAQKLNLDALIALAGTLKRERDEALAALADHGVDGLPPADGVRTLAGCVESVKSAARLARQAADTKSAEARRFEEELDAVAQALGCGRAGILEAIEDLKTARETLAAEVSEAHADEDRLEEELDDVAQALGCSRFESSKTLRRLHAEQMRKKADLEERVEATESEIRRLRTAYSATFTSANALLNALAAMEVG